MGRGRTGALSKFGKDRFIHRWRIFRAAILQKWVPYSQRYLFNAIPDTNRNANPINPNRHSKGNPNPTNPTNPTNPNTGTVVNKAPTSAE